MDAAVAVIWWHRLIADLMNLLDAERFSFYLELSKIVRKKDHPAGLH